MTVHTSCTRPAMDLGNRWSAGLSLNTAARASGSIDARAAASSASAQPFPQVVGRPEGPLQGYLLVQDHGDE